MRVTRLQLRQIIREVLETAANSDVTFRPGDVVDAIGLDSGLWQVLGIEGEYASVRSVGSMLDGQVETRLPLSRLVRSNYNA